MDNFVVVLVTCGCFFIIFDNLKHVLVDAIVLFGDLCQETIAYKLITFRVDGVSVFQGIVIGVTI
jgi:hypothetical protein